VTTASIKAKLSYYIINYVYVGNKKYNISKHSDAKMESKTTYNI